MYNIGDWVCYRGKDTAKVIDRRSLWGVTTYAIYISESRSIERAMEQHLSPLSPTAPSAERIVFSATAAKLVEAMSQGALLSPFHGSLIPLPHQIQCLQRALGADMVRFLLADEVGLGKTIEAGLIMRELKLRGLAKRVLIVAPKGLTEQWQEEMRSKFGEEFSLILPSAFSALRRAAGKMNIWRSSDQVICPLDSVKPIDTRKGWTAHHLETYNRERFEDLVTAGWDLVIVDEAHRIGGSTSEVARYKLGNALSDAAPYLLLLSATPHQGKTDSFWRLISLLDKQAFPDASSVTRARVAPYIVRTEKRLAIDTQGKPLFKKRHTQLATVPWSTPLHGELYRRVTEYVRKGYNLAMREKRNYIGFLMVLMQRLVTSSTPAIIRALEKRLAVLELDPSEQAFTAPAWWECDGEDMLDLIDAHQEQAMQDEKAQVEDLLTLARRAAQASPDGKALAMLDIVRSLEVIENNPELKVLVFTEFIPTQQMLEQFLKDRGISVVTLNGSMDIDERKQVQDAFRSNTRVLVSTDAGGEGLNLQFCHVVFNYDLPWNPMRIEQRIGRVDRIGQSEDVRAYNLIIDEEVEKRLRQVLEDKLQAILAEFGIDKTSDVLDSGEAIADFDRLFVDMIVNPEKAEHELERLLAEFRRQAAQAAAAKKELYSSEPISPALAQQVAESPIPYWVEQMTKSFLTAEGVHIRYVGESSYEVIWPGETALEKVSFRETTHASGVASLEHPRIRALLDRLSPVVPGVPLALLELMNIGLDLSGVWGLWKLTLKSGDSSIVRIAAVFRHDDGRVLRSSAARIWEYITEGGPIIVAPTNEYLSDALYEDLDSLAQAVAEDLYKDMTNAYTERLEREQRKMEYAFARREEATSRHGLPQVRAFRLRELSKEKAKWVEELEQRKRPVPELTPILICKVVAR